ncbi:putative DST1 protein [Echria macrotheca]|uniref:DST1 protein n=1 Tax=Echria macrotheca TaxID=438768 RepID=A0AAJ0BFL6_9PEZI|nr:putative DST1 protein [Echria macrotheca]
MDDRDLTLRVRALTKAMQNDSTAEALRILGGFMKGAAPTESQLRSTRAGVVVGKLRSNPNREIAQLAGQIVINWKKNVDAAKDSNRGRTPSASSPAPRAVASPAPASTSFSKPYEGDIEKRHFRTDKIELNRTGSDTRNNSIGLLYNALAFSVTDSIEAVLERAMEVEAACFKAYKGETADYRLKLRALFTALKRKDNAKLRRRVLDGDVRVDQLVVMTSKELASEEQRALDDAYAKDNMKKAQVPMVERSISSQLKCGKCGEKKVSYSQAQTRSADEPMTTFCECVVCGNRWKFS